MSGLGHRMNVRRVQTLVASFDIEFHLLTFRERLESFHRDRGEVNEDILSTFLFDEAVTLGVIEPLHLSPGHVNRLRL